MKTNISFMAFSRGTVATEGGAVKRYIGVAPVYVLAVNPNKAQIKELMGYEPDAEPEYVTTKDGVTSARLDFIVKTDAEKCNGIELTTRYTFFVRKEFKYNRDQTKVQVIDKYGRTAWVTKEQAQTHAIPQYANGPANLDSDYRPVYNGEEEVTNFVKAFLNIPNVMKYIDKKWVMVDNPAECEARLGNVEALFTGDFKELKEIISYQPNNKVKVMFGVRTNDEGKQFQTIFTEMVLKNGVSDYSRLDAYLKDRKNNGAYATTEFSVLPLAEYKVEATNFSATPTSTMPTEAVDVNAWFKA